MKKAIKTKWIKALRSGKYIQTRKVLERCDSNGMPLGNCCLGVLCRVLEIPVSYSYAYVNKFDGMALELNTATLKLAGLTVEQASALERMNDIEQLSFDDIACYIESRL